MAQTTHIQREYSMYGNSKHARIKSHSELGPENIPKATVNPRSGTPRQLWGHQF